VARPWFDVFLPDGHVDDYVERVLAELNPAEDVGPPALGALGQIHLFPLWTRHLRRPLLRVPSGELVFLFDILTAAHGPGSDAVYAARMIERNQRLFDDARRLGGTRYAIAAIPISEAAWSHELGPAHAAFAKQKRRHDPHGIMAIHENEGRP
jgi:cytokinin dehydrogenase